MAEIRQLQSINLVMIEWLGLALAKFYQSNQRYHRSRHTTQKDVHAVDILDGEDHCGRMKLGTLFNEQFRGFNVMPTFVG